ncbi:MAG: sulfotransferase [Sandaracinaceae bacterium]|nr:sulfotransferase [Sandaracinaceae bacterium]
MSHGGAARISSYASDAMRNRLNRLAVAIGGAGHSGSTLLGLVLGSHGDVFYAGEAKKSLFIGDEKKPLRKRVCKMCGPDCEVWSRFTVPPEPDLYEQLSRLTGRSVVVDSTKKPEWIRERRAEVDAGGGAHKIVYLVRDGRAVVNSRVRKYPELAPEVHVDQWIAQIQETDALVAERPDAAIQIRYEELATEPEATVRRVCEFLEVAFEPSMLAYESVPHHPLGGNTGTQSVVARAASIDSELAKIPNRSAGFYAGLRGGFSLDLRWRDELPDEVLRVFEARATETNERFRWEAR